MANRSNTRHQSAITALQAALGDHRISVQSTVLDEMSHDWWPVSILAARQGLHPTRPDIVVYAEAENDVIETLAIAREYEVPVTARGLGSSATGQDLPTEGGIMLSLERCEGIPQLDEINRLVTVPAGTRGSVLETWLNERGYTLNHYPQSLARSSVAGWLATRASGQLSTKYGGIENLVAGYRVVLSSGDVIDIQSKPRAAVGPDLRQLFLGSEGTFGIIVSVTLRVFAENSPMLTSAYTFADVRTGLAAIREIAQGGCQPALVRFYDEYETAYAVNRAPVDGCVLFLGFDSPGRIAHAESEYAESIIARNGGRIVDSGLVDAWLDRRTDYSTVEAILREPGGYAETIEVAHLWSDINDLYHGLRNSLEPLADKLLMHFSHVYDQGISLYAILLGNTGSDSEASDRLHTIWQTAMEVTLRSGGEVSHHHGAGLARRGFIQPSLNSQHVLLRKLKSALDPIGILNPGKLDL